MKKNTPAPAQKKKTPLSITAVETHNAGSNKIQRGYFLVIRGHTYEFWGLSTRIRNQKVTLMLETACALTMYLLTYSHDLDLWSDGFCFSADCTFTHRSPKQLAQAR